MLINAGLTAILFVAPQATSDAKDAPVDSGEPAVQIEAADKEPETAKTDVAEASDDKKVICKRTVITGSKFTKRICGTKDEWAAMTRRGRDAAAEVQRRGKGVDPVN